MSHELDAFILGLYPKATTKTSGLDAFTASELGRIYGTPAPHLEAAEKLAHDSACFLEQFEGTPLHEKAIALIGEELQIEAERIQRDEARRAQAEPVDDSWSKSRMLDLKKRQLELELHKMKAQHEATEAPEQEIAEHAEGVPAPMTTGAVPAKTASEKVAVSLTWIGNRISRYGARTNAGNLGERLSNAAQAARRNNALSKAYSLQRDVAGTLRTSDQLGEHAMKRRFLAQNLKDFDRQPMVRAAIDDKRARDAMNAARQRAYSKHASAQVEATKLARRSSSTTYHSDGSSSRSYHSEQPDVGELRLAQRRWSKMTPEQRKAEFRHLPWVGALSLGALGTALGGTVGKALGHEAIGGATGAVAGGLAGHALGKRAKELQGSRDEVPAAASYRLARRQILDEEGGRRKKTSSAVTEELLQRAARGSSFSRNPASYLSPKDILAHATQSAKTQAGGMSRDVASYAPARARLHQLAARGNTVAAEALKRGELDLEKAAGLKEFLGRLTSTRAQRIAKMDARGAAALAKSRASSPARSAVRGMIDELHAVAPRASSSEVSGVRRIPAAGMVTPRALPGSTPASLATNKSIVGTPVSPVRGDLAARLSAYKAGKGIPANAPPRTSKFWAATHPET